MSLHFAASDFPLARVESVLGRGEGPWTRREAVLAIRQFMAEIRGPWADARTEPPMPGYFYLPFRFQGKPIDLPLGCIGTRGCSWARTGGCTMCDYGGHSRTSTPDEIRAQIHHLFGKWGYPRIANLTAQGSVFDEQEMPEEHQRVFFETIREMPNLEYLGVESRAEFISPSVVERAVRWLGHVKLSVGLGLESLDDTVRNVYINKNLTLDDYHRALDVLRGADVLPVTHVLFKPPFLTEQEAIEEARRTIRYANEAGSPSTVLMLNNVKANTLTWWLWKRGEYRVPWLWSVIEMLRGLSKEELKGLFVYGFRSWNGILETAGNCPDCTDRVRQVIDELDYAGSVRGISASESELCSCRRMWEVHIRAVFREDRKVKSSVQGLLTRSSTRTPFSQPRVFPR